MNPKEELRLLEEIIDEILRGVQETIQSGEVLSDEFQGQLAEEITHATDRIDQIRQEISKSLPEQEIDEEIEQIDEEITQGEQPPSPPSTPIPELDAAPHESSNINAFKYDPKSQELFVKFQGKYPNQNGPVYSYEGVPKHIFDVFRRGAVAPKTSGKNAWHTWKKGVTPSHGASMYALIREGGYRYLRRN